MRLLILSLFLCLISFSARAQEAGNIVIDLAENNIDITSGFTGETVTVFGTTDQVGDIALVLKGPLNRVTMRKKEPVLGMWLNRRSVDFKNVPLFYSYAVSRSEEKIADFINLRNDSIGLNAMEFDAADYRDDTNIQEFEEAMIRTRQAGGFFPLMPSNVRFLGQKLFRASFYLPSNVPVGQYKVEAYLFREGQLIGSRALDLRVAQAGLSGSILNFAVEHSFFYALAGLLMAVAAGFIAFWVSRNQRI